MSWLLVWDLYSRFHIEVSVLRNSSVCDMAEWLYDMLELKCTFIMRKALYFSIYFLLQCFFTPLQTQPILGNDTAKNSAVTKEWNLFLRKKSHSVHLETWVIQSKGRTSLLLLEMSSLEVHHDLTKQDLQVHSPGGITGCLTSQIWALSKANQCTSCLWGEFPALSRHHEHTPKSPHTHCLCQPSQHGVIIDKKHKNY